MSFEFKVHNLVDHPLPTLEKAGDGPNVAFDLRPCLNPDGSPAEGLFNAWITLNNPKQYNSYTTQMIKDVILAFRQASNTRNVVAAIFTAAGNKAFCTGGNTKEYAEYYAGRPEEYRQYMRLFNDMVSAILHCDKPVICRVNGMRIAGGQEIGMACDFTVASDLANFGQAGPRHGSVADGGSTDFLPLFVGIENAMFSCTLCEPWSSYRAKHLGLITDAIPTLKVTDKFIPNPMVVTDRWLEGGRIVYGDFVQGEERARGKQLLKEGTTDLTPLDAAIDKMCTSLMQTFPGCISKSVESMRKHKLVHWDKNRETNRAWLGLNMMTEGKAGFRAFNEGIKGQREVNFAKLRRLLAEGMVWGDELLEEVMPPRKK